MSTINGFGAIKAYGISRVQEEAIVARNTDDFDTQMRIAKESTDRLILLNLALNQNLNEDVVQAMFDRGIDYLTSRLKNLGFVETKWYEVWK
jgi:hypothetical protein